MTLLSLKGLAIPMLFGLTGVAAGGGFSLASYLANSSKVDKNEESFSAGEKSTHSTVTPIQEGLQSTTFSRNNFAEETYDLSKKNSKIIAEYIYKDEKSEFLGHSCEYWVDIQQESGKIMLEEECTNLVKNSLEEQKQSQPIIWLQVKKDYFSNIFEKYFFSGSIYGDNLVEEGQKWIYRNNNKWSCTKLSKKDSEKITVSCDKEATNDNAENDFFPEN